MKTVSHQLKAIRETARVTADNIAHPAYPLSLDALAAQACKLADLIAELADAQLRSNRDLGE